MCRSDQWRLTPQNAMRLKASAGAAGAEAIQRTILRGSGRVLFANVIWPEASNTPYSGSSASSWATECCVLVCGLCQTLAAPKGSNNCVGGSAWLRTITGIIRWRQNNMVRYLFLHTTPVVGCLSFSLCDHQLYFLTSRHCPGDLPQFICRQMAL